MVVGSGVLLAEGVVCCDGRGGNSIEEVSEGAGGVGFWGMRSVGLFGGTVVWWVEG